MYVSNYSSHTTGLTQKKSLFSIDANMCRLRAQLAVEANTRYYNITYIACLLSQPAKVWLIESHTLAVEMLCIAVVVVIHVLSWTVIDGVRRFIVKFKWGRLSH